MNVAEALDRMRNYPDGSYMRCPFCGCKSSKHEPECAIEIVAKALAGGRSETGTPDAVLKALKSYRELLLSKHTPPTIPQPCEKCEPIYEVERLIASLEWATRSAIGCPCDEYRLLHKSLMEALGRSEAKNDEIAQLRHERNVLQKICAERSDELEAIRSATLPPKEIITAVNALLDAEDMTLHNEAIFKGKWKKGSKAWSGDFIERTVNEAMVKLRAILRPKEGDSEYVEGGR